MGTKVKVLIVCGTRPEVIKLAPVIAQFSRLSSRIETRICLSGQHNQMVRPLLQLFGISPDYDLRIMRRDQTIEYVTTAVMNKLGAILDREPPDYLLVQGDTTTAMAAALAAYYRKIKVAHVEAGLRTGDRFNPFPEEVNRSIIDLVSDVCFAPTRAAAGNLVRAGISRDRVNVTGNTIVDAVNMVVRMPADMAAVPVSVLEGRGPVVLVTVHRRENLGAPLAGILGAIRTIARKNPGVQFVYPVHLNPNVRGPAFSLLGGERNIALTDPLRYEVFLKLMRRAGVIITDSGGLQEEATVLGKPVLVLRTVTERPEAVAAGIATVVGVDPIRIVAIAQKAIGRLVDGRGSGRRSAVFGDGKAAVRIARYFCHGRE